MYSSVNYYMACILVTIRQVKKLTLVSHPESSSLGPFLPDHSPLHPDLCNHFRGLLFSFCTQMCIHRH